MQIIKKNKKTPLEFSKKLTIFDNIIWTFLTILLIVAMFINSELGTYCSSMLTTITAAFVSVRLGYTAKSGVENYNKITKSLSGEITDTSSNEGEAQG